MATIKTNTKFSDDDLKRYDEFIKIFNTVYPQNSKNTRNRNFTLDLQGGNPALSAIGDSITATGNVFSAFGRAFGDKDPKGLAGAYALGGNLYSLGSKLFGTDESGKVKVPQGDWKSWDKNKGLVGNISQNAGAIGDVAKGAVGLVKNFSNMSQLGVSKEEIDAVKSANMNTGKMYSDYDALDQAMSSHRDKGHVSWRDLMADGGPLNHYAYGGWTQDVGNTFNAAGQGAKAGSHFGPIGAGVGAGLGVLSSGLGIWARKRKAKREARRINRWNDYGNARDARGFGDSATQIAEEGINEALANYAALGGPLEYSLKSRALDIAQDAVNNESITDDDDESGVSIFAKGGKIHIKEKNKGKFGAAAKKAGMSTQAYARKVLANKDKYSPTLVKRANFARNAAKWKHGDGGSMDEENKTHMEEIYPDMETIVKYNDPMYQVTTAAKYINPVEVGKKAKEMAKNVKKNILDWQKEKQKQVHETNKLLLSLRDSMTPEDVAALILGGPIIGTINASQRHSQDLVDQAADGKPTVMEPKYPNMHAFGGNLGTNGADFTNGNIEVNAGGSHEENPNGGVQMGVDPNGVPNLVEQGELINNDYVYSDRLVVPGSYRGKYGNRRGKGAKGGKTFAKAAKKASRESVERPNDPISKRGLQTQLSQLAQQQELVRAQQRAQNAINQLAVQQSKAMMQPGARIAAIGGLILNPFNHYGNFNPLAHYGNYNPVANKYDGDEATTNDTQQMQQATLPFTLDDELWRLGFPSRFMGTMVGADILGITNRPNYKFANQLLGASNQTGFERVNYKPVAGYMPYRRLDPTRFITPMQQDYAGMNRYLAQNAGMNANAANADMMAAQQQHNNAIGETRQQVADQDWEQLLGTKQFNFGINQLNAQNALDAAKSNQQGRLAAANSRLENLREGYKMATDAFNISEAGRGQNISQFLEEKGNYGKAKFNFVQAILDADARARAGMGSHAYLKKYLNLLGMDTSNLGNS